MDEGDIPDETVPLTAPGPRVSATSTTTTVVATSEPATTTAPTTVAAPPVTCGPDPDETHPPPCD